MATEERLEVCTAGQSCPNFYNDFFFARVRKREILKREATGLK
jgi:hypothetical protein